MRVQIPAGTRWQIFIHIEFWSVQSLISVQTYSHDKKQFFFDLKIARLLCAGITQVAQWRRRHLPHQEAQTRQGMHAGIPKRSHVWVTRWGSARGVYSPGWPSEGHGPLSGRRSALSRSLLSLPPTCHWVMERLWRLLKGQRDSKKRRGVCLTLSQWLQTPPIHHCLLPPPTPPLQPPLAWPLSLPSLCRSLRTLELC